MMRTLAHGVLAVAGLIAPVVLSACGGGEDTAQAPTLDCSGEPTVEALGTGNLESGFVALPAAGDLQLTLAYNGAHTVMIGARLTGFNQGSDTAFPVTVALRVGDVVVGGAVERLAPTGFDEQRTEFVGIRTLLVHDVTQWRDKSIDLEWTATDACEREATASAAVHLVF